MYEKCKRNKDFDDSEKRRVERGVASILVVLLLAPTRELCHQCLFNQMMIVVLEDHATLATPLGQWEQQRGKLSNVLVTVTGSYLSTIVTTTTTRPVVVRRMPGLHSCRHLYFTLLCARQNADDFLTIVVVAAEGRAERECNN